MQPLTQLLKSSAQVLMLSALHHENLADAVRQLQPGCFMWKSRLYVNIRLEEML